jgi:hypothetical protein
MRVLIWLCQRHLRSRDLSAQHEGRVFLKIYLVEPKRLTLCPNSVEYLIAQLHSGSLICGMMLGSIRLTRLKAAFTSFDSSRKSEYPTQAIRLLLAKFSVARAWRVARVVAVPNWPICVRKSATQRQRHVGP